MPKAIRSLKELLKIFEESGDLEDMQPLVSKRELGQYYDLIDRPDFKYPHWDSQDFFDLWHYAHEPSSVDSRSIRRIVDQYGIALEPDAPLYRGLNWRNDDARPAWVKSLYEPGGLASIAPKAFASTTTSERRAKKFARYPDSEILPVKGAGVTVELLRDGPIKAFPLVNSLESEILVPATRFRVARPPENKKMSVKRDRDAPAGYAGGGKVTKGLRALGRSMEDPAIRQEMWHNSKAPMPGMFSTLDELIQAAPIPDEAKAAQWEEYLRPGRALVREDVTFPLKAEELEYTLVKPYLERLKRENALLTRNQLLEFTRRNRPDFPGAVGTDTSSRRVRQSDQSFGERYLADGEDVRDGLRSLKGKLPQWHYPGLHTADTAVPGSYEELVTHMLGLHDHRSSHFGPDSLSWSRATQQPLNLGSSMMRYIEEIQADVNAKAADKLFKVTPDLADMTLTTPGRYIDETERNRERPDSEIARAEGRQALAALDALQPERRGYYKDVNKRLREFAAINGIDDLEEAHARFSADPGYDIEEAAKVAREKSQVPDVPFKSPADYGLLELKKQMMNAARQGDDYLGITPSSVQVRRYAQGLSESDKQGMQHVYDKIYPSQLEKLARQYGIGMEDVELQTSDKIDARPPLLAVNDLETVGELVEALYPDAHTRLGTGEAIDTIKELLDTSYEMSTPETNDAARRVRAMIEDYEMMDNEDTAAEWYENNFQELASHLQFLDDEFRHMTAHEQGDGSGYTTNKIRAMRLTPEAREKIKRIGVPLWTVPAAGVGLEATMGSQEEPQGYAGGGLVGKGLRQVVQDIKNENPYAGRRAERIMDEEPRLDSILSPRGLERLAMNPAPVILMRPDIRPDKASEYRRMALPLLPRKLDEMPVDDFMHSAELLEKFRSEGGMNVPPMLFANLDDGGVMQITGHDGRHRAFGLGEILGMKVPTQFDRVVDMTLPESDRRKFIKGLGTQTLNDIFDEVRIQGGHPRLPPVPKLEGDTVGLLEDLLQRLNSMKVAKQELSGDPKQPIRETSLRNKKGDRFFAGGGSVSEAIAALRKRSKVATRRAERVLDEDPKLAQLLTGDALRDLAENPAPVAVLTPDEFKGIAPVLMLNKDGRANIDMLRDSIARSGLIEPPYLGLLPESKSKLRAYEHQGRHRARAFGQLGAKVPTQAAHDDYGTDTSMLSREFLEGQIREAEDEGDYALYNRLIRKEPKRPTIYQRGMLDALERALSDYNSRDTVIPERSPLSVLGLPPAPDVKIGKDRFFAKGGEVRLKAKKIGEKARELGALRGAHAERRARIASAMLSNLYGVTPEGELTSDTLPRFDLMQGGFTWPNRPGLVEGTLGLAELLLPEAATPDFIKGSGERYESTLGQLQQAMGVAPAEGLGDHLSEALGNMLTQIPVPAGASRGVRGALSGLVEYVTPTVTPSLRNYAGGTAVGGAFTKGLQELAERLPGMRDSLRGIDPRAPSLEWDPGR